MTTPKLTPPPPTGIGVLDRWLNLLWRNLTGAGQISWGQVDKTGASISDMDDVTVTTPSDGEVLSYSNGEWVNSPPSGSATTQAYAARHG